MKHKKYLALILAIIMSALSAIPVAAATYEDKDTVYKEVSFDGETYAASATFNDIYEFDDKYVMQVSTDDGIAFIPVERVDISFSNADSASEFMNRKDIPQEAIDSFRKKYEMYINSEKKEEVPSLVLFEPSSKNATKSGGDPDSILYYTYNGWSMMTYQFNYTNLSTGWKTIKSGKSTKDIASLAYNIALSVGSVANKYLSFFSAGKSILTSFVDYYGLTSNAVTKCCGQALL